jgi:PIN domain nuclease of toxin-antitoxin system
MRYLLDTVTFLLATTSPEKLSRRVKAMLDNSTDLREISALSLSEIAIKNGIGKMTFDKADVTTGIADLRLRVLPFSLNHALKFFDLPRHHADPFDRQIIAQALSEDLAIVTCDNKFRLYHGLTVIW